MRIFSSPVLLLIETIPLPKPKAMYCPSLVHEQQFTLAGTFCFWTDFCSADHRPKSLNKHNVFDEGCVTNLLMFRYLCAHDAN